MPRIAVFSTEVFEMDTAPFKIDGTTPEEILVALAEKIAQEIQSVEGYVSTWRASGVMGATPHKKCGVEYS